MVLGTGIDIIEVQRVQTIAERNPRFLERIFTSREIDYCMKKRNKYQHLAARFAAKEAFFKALGKRISWTAVELYNLSSGKPELKIKNKQKLHVDKAHVSISHLKDYAVAAVILEGIK
jgi:holo-[acyl-carrier protein] synthase